MAKTTSKKATVEEILFINKNRITLRSTSDLKSCSLSIEGYLESTMDKGKTTYPFKSLVPSLTAAREAVIAAENLPLTGPFIIDMDTQKVIFNDAFQRMKKREDSYYDKTGKKTKPENTAAATLKVVIDKHLNLTKADKDGIYQNALSAKAEIDTVDSSVFETLDLVDDKEEFDNAIAAYEEAKKQYDAAKEAKLEAVKKAKDELDSLIKAACNRIDSDQRFTKGAYNSLVKKVNALYLKFQKKDTSKTTTTKTTTTTKK